MLAHADVTRVDDLHIREVTSGMPALSARLYVHPDVDCHDTRREVETMLAERFDITHVTLQTDHAPADANRAPDANCGHCG